MSKKIGIISSGFKLNQIGSINYGEYKIASQKDENES
tara:strand:+ start:46182 stop:46292 length:111 start_codon:yes stop_codon:yes gene_type:complete